MRYSDGSIRLLHDDVWQAQYVYTVEAEDGKVCKKAIARNFRAADHLEAHRERDRIREQLERETLLEELVPAAAKAPLLSKLMRDQVDGMLKSGVIEKTTHAKYQSEASPILHFMKDVQISKVTGALFRKMDQDMRAAGYARETVARAHNALKRHLYSAQEKGYIASMPITRSNRPPRLEWKDPNGLDKQTRRRLSRIVNEMPDTPFTLAIRLGLGAGLRNEEAFGLKWDYVDLKNGIIKIRNVISMAGRTPIEKGPKTAAGRGDIPIDPDLTRRLRQRAKSVFGSEDTSSLQGLYVLGSDEGMFLRHTDLTRAFHSFALQHGIYGTTGQLASVYSLRHTYASMLLRAGVDAKTVASLMGHSNVAMTLNIYASTDPQARAAAGAVVADLMAQR